MLMAETVLILAGWLMAVPLAALGDGTASETAAGDTAASVTGPGNAAPNDMGPQNTVSAAPDATRPSQGALRLPAGTLVSIEVPGWAAMKEALQGSRFLELVRETEVGKFLRRPLERAREDLRMLARKRPKLLDHLLERAPGSISMALMDIQPAAGEEESPLFLWVFMVGFEDRAKNLYDEMLAAAREEDDKGKLVTATLAGHDLFRVESEDAQAVAALFASGERLVLTLGRGAESLLLEGKGPYLDEDSLYMLCRERCHASASMPFAFVAVQRTRGIVEQILAKPDEGGAKDWESELVKAQVVENPKLKSIEALGYAVTSGGPELADRLLLVARGDQSGWGKLEPIGKSALSHSSLLPRDADFFATRHFDAADALAQYRKEAERLKDAVDEARKASGAEQGGENEESLIDPTSLLKTFKEKTGVDLEAELVPVLGNQLSLAFSMPSGLLAIPDGFLVVDLAEPTAFDAVLAKLVAKDAEVTEVEITQQEYQGHTITSVQLVNTQLPFLPSLVRLENRLLVALTPLALKRALAESGGEKSLSTRSEFQPGERLVEGATAYVWVDLGEVFRWVYGLLGTALSAVKASGKSDIGSRWDVDQLPDGALLGRHLGVGTMSIARTEEGLIVEGRSTLGNPAFGLTGLVAGVAMGVVALEGLHAAANSERRELCEERLKKLMQAAEMYKTSMGGGTYPTSLVDLYDRGLVTDPEVFIDPSDPKPRSMKTGTGERLSVSFRLGFTESLAAEMHSSYGFLAAASPVFVASREAAYDNRYLLAVWHAGDVRILTDPPPLSVRVEVEERDER
ncbi:MAG: DUF3352 domain-containing protein [Planctomycetota bacterium]